MRRVLSLAVLLAAACGERVVEVRSRGQTLVFVDSDLPVPRFVSRLRIDLYTTTGRWYASRDFSLARPSDWPTSFGVFLPENEPERVAVVRLRAYPEGFRRDYRGERFVARPPRTLDASSVEDLPLPPATEAPRLIDEAGSDATPETEPQPLLAIDRLVRVAVRPADRTEVHVDLRAACVGTMADVAGMRTCVDTEAVLVPVETAEPRSQTERRPTFDPVVPCTITPRAGTPGLFDDEVCIAGAMFRLGSEDGVFGNAEALPERVAILDAFLLDRWEVTVARLRAAIARGFVVPDGELTANEGPIPTTRTPFEDPSLCSWSTTPQGREAHAVTCIGWAGARAFCRFEGGDLPSEAEWEYAAAVAARPFRTRFAWGGPDDATPTCERATWGRGETPFEQLCVGNGFGPLPADARSGPEGDLTPETRIVNLGGGVAEWTRDAFAKMSARCWASAPLREPGCEVDGATSHTIRGATWRDNLVALIAGTRRFEEKANSAVGFRCMRKGSP